MNHHDFTHLLFRTMTCSHLPAAASRPAGRWRPLVASAALLLAPLLAWATPLEDIRRQVEASQFEQAYRTGQSNPQLIGDVHFDFLYGVAAINVGRVAEGVLALERHLSAVPANDRARLELARGYFLLGEFTRARSEFEFVLRYNPPAGVRATINGFLQAMQVRDAADSRARARLYAEFGLGYDTNVNGGSYRDQISAPFGDIVLTGTPSKRLADGLAQVALGGQQVLRVTNRLSVFAGADLDQRTDFKEHDYDQTNGAAYVGFTQLGSLALWRVALSTSELRIGGDRYRDTLALNGESTMNLDAETSLQIFAGFSEQRYAVENEALNSRLSTVGVMWTRSFGDLPGSPSFGARVGTSVEQVRGISRYLNRDTPTLRIFGAVSPADRWRLSLGLTGSHAHYHNVDPNYLTSRSDDALVFDAVANYAIDNQWSVRAEALWSTNRSNQDLYDSNRAAATVKVRYQF
jgi:tetratricopeptide (TPR) repeat protein